MTGRVQIYDKKFEVDSRVGTCAQILDDSVLLGKLVRGDPIAIKANSLLELYIELLMFSCGGWPYRFFIWRGKSLALAEVIAYLRVKYKF